MSSFIVCETCGTEVPVAVDIEKITSRVKVVATCPKCNHQQWYAASEAKNG